MKSLPLGVENFKRIIDENYYYIDKTDLITETLNEQFALYTRPRRFGKTLNMSMLYYFFSVKEKENAYLFEHLKVSGNKNTMQHQNQYPVIFITLKDMQRNRFELQVEKYRSIVSMIIESYSEILTSPSLNAGQRKLMNEYLNRESSESDLMDALLNISRCLEKHYHQKTMILIDEYDVPLQSAYLNGFYDEMVYFLRSAFSAALKTNDALERGVLTGCLRISKESIFTGLNNFQVYSIMDYRNSKSFGFTQNEVEQLLMEYRFEKYKDEVREWYDGYLFGNTEIYNPWSTLMYVDRKLQSEELNAISFWANTSSNSLVVDYIEKADAKMQEEFETLMQGKSIIKKLKPELTYKEMDNQDNVYSFLLLTGYLKVKKEVSFNTYELVIPNREVYEIYNQSFMDCFSDYVKARKSNFIKALLEERVNDAQKILSDILFKRISYYDNNESFYHGLLIGLLDDYGVDSNKEIGEGRPDIVVYPQSFSEKAIIFECKHSVEESNMVGDSQEGAAQIRKRRYREGVVALGYDGAIGYGISFYKKRCKLTLV